MLTKVCLVIAFAILASETALFAQDDQLRAALDNLVAAYPSALAGHDGKMLRWRDGTVMPVSDGTENKPFQELLRHASIADQFHISYPRGPLENLAARDGSRFQSGRICCRFHANAIVIIGVSF